MSATASLRRDHELIEKVLKAMESTLSLLKEDKKIPEIILRETIDFTKNFTDVCHHGKEENSLFPALEKAGMPTTMGPIAIMLMDHKITKEIAEKIESAVDEYLQKGNSDQLILSISQYIEHVTEHLWKENNRLFMMADTRLIYNRDSVDENLNKEEQKQLDSLGKTREHYEKLVSNLESHSKS